MTTYTKDSIKIIEVPEIVVAIMEHRGNPAKIGDTVKRFIEWRKTTGLLPSSSATFNIFHTDPLTTKPEDFRMDLCAQTRQPIGKNDARVKAGRIPSGRCATLRIAGSSDDLEAAAAFLYRDWLPESGEEVRGFPFYCQRVSFFPDVPEHEAVTDLFLPLR